ncbi:BTAD domain-containing putative transcriptional regulator [Streptomyces polygonati]|uniref:BTAD domain-containing putative transcriptional regulator n=1 Tax=Streptomyces polygonati TaxID=1617087 RepID=A0ABV8HND4_9ACTN
MRFGLLGAVMVREGDGSVSGVAGGPPPAGSSGAPAVGARPAPAALTRPFGSAKTRALLAALLATPGRTVSPGALKSALWGDRPPPTASASLHNHVARLRKLLAQEGRGDARLRAVPPGYLLDVADGELDAQLFAGHHAAARAAHRDRDWAAVLRECGAAMALWRGEPLADVPLLSDGLRAYAAHLAEARLLTLEWRFDAELALGRHQGLTAELAALTGAHPLRESFHRQLMLALHRTHRQAEALAAFHKLRGTLVDELGVEPGPSVQAAYREILTTPSSAAPPTTPPPAAEEPAAGRPAPAQLPAEVPDFTGRVDALAALLRVIRPCPAAGGEPPAAASTTPGTGSGSPTPRIVVISGMGGVGKTALAVRAAHLAQPAFPDGQLYADLRGFGAGGARRPGDLLARFLGALGQECQPLPEHPDDRAVLLREALHGRRVLLVLDNAADAAQVVPLLPGCGDSAVIVTSRRTLADLPGAVRLPLEPLNDDEQRELLASVCGAHRVAAEPAAAAGVLAACGGLPLALRIAGARLAARPNWPLTALADRLEPTGDRLRALSAGGLAVEDTFAMSYVAMRDSPRPAEREAARAFRLLGLWPGYPLDPSPAAVLLDRAPATAAEDVLEALVDAHLLQTPQPGRYTFHDLLGEYAATRAGHEIAPAERLRALRRLVVWYEASVAATADVLTPEGHPIPPLDERPAVPAARFDGDESAMRWLVRELPAVKEAIRVARTHRWPDVAWRLAAGLFGYAQAFWWTGEWQRCLEEAMACAQENEDVLGQAWMHSRLGVAHGMVDRYDDCAHHLLIAQRYFEEAGDLRGQAAMLTNLGGLHRGLGDYERALEYGRRSVALHLALGDVHRVATVLGNLGDAYLGAGDLAAAEGSYRQALAAWRERGSVVHIARILTSLGETLHGLGRHQEAVAALEETLVLLDRLGDRATTADVLDILGRTHFAYGDPAVARACWEEALIRAREHRLPAVAESVERGLARMNP